ncbi:hypothetical protein CRENBAI_020643 [Crenichthys baileyi]|uniref:Uncharacterized protein n=1 Tax=Crenichthys baileyi TaxID=28760 RepID=A0AAV9RUJ3_9TELE
MKEGTREEGICSAFVVCMKYSRKVSYCLKKPSCFIMVALKSSVQCSLEGYIKTDIKAHKGGILLLFLTILSASILFHHCRISLTTSQSKHGVSKSIINVDG